MLGWTEGNAESGDILTLSLEFAYSSIPFSGTGKFCSLTRQSAFVTSGNANFQIPVIVYGNLIDGKFILPIEISSCGFPSR
jgi:hypothetical protein